MVASIPQLRQNVQRRAAGVGPQHAIVFAVSLAKVASNGAQYVGIVVDSQYDWLRHVCRISRE